MSEQLAEILQRINDLERALSETVVRGKISEVDAVNYLVKVAYGSAEKPMHTAWLPIKPIRSGAAIVWWFPEVGEGATVISPGNLLLGEVYPGSYHAQTPAPSDNPDLFIVQFGDGSQISHDRSTGDYTATYKGSAIINTEKDTTINTAGETSINSKGNALLSSKGSVTIHSDAKNISLNNGAGVVTGAHVCAYTGAPHSDCSSQVKAGK
jgi:phage baseplate assembly protein V